MVRALVVIALTLIACKSGDKKAPPVESKPAAGSSGSAAPAAPATPSSPLAQVQAMAPSGSTVKPVADLKVSGVELFAITPATPGDEDFHDGRLIGVADGKTLEGRELIQAAGAAKADPTTLARLALWAYQEDGQLLDKAGNAEQAKAHVTGPQLKGNVLKLWVWLDDPPTQLERGTVDLSTGVLTLGPLPAKPDEMISTAIRVLTGENQRRYPKAIEMLVQTCAEPRAKQSLLAVMTSNPRDKTRAQVIEQIHKCGPTIVDKLVFAMEHDRSAMVRAKAATALGRLGDGRARPSLAKAMRGDDQNLADAARAALAKIQ